MTISADLQNLTGSTSLTIESEITTIRQGRSRSSCFTIIQPCPGIHLKVKQPVKCLNPKTNVLTTGIVLERWTFEWESPPTGLILLAYGIDPQLLRNALLVNDQAYYDPWAIIYLIKETI